MTPVRSPRLCLLVPTSRSDSAEDPADAYRFAAPARTRHHHPLQHALQPLLLDLEETYVGGTRRGANATVTWTRAATVKRQAQLPGVYLRRAAAPYVPIAV
jgi:hypothetical protein